MKHTRGSRFIFITWRYRSEHTAKSILTEDTFLTTNKLTRKLSMMQLMSLLVLKYFLYNLSYVNRSPFSSSSQQTKAWNVWGADYTNKNITTVYVRFLISSHKEHKRSREDASKTYDRSFKRIMLTSFLKK